MASGETTTLNEPGFDWLGPQPDLVPDEQYRGPSIRIDVEADPLLAIDQSSPLPELPYGDYEYEI